MTPNQRGVAFALAAFGLFSTHDVLVKMLGGLYSPAQTIFFAALFGFPLSVVMLLGDSTQGTLRPKRPLWMALRTAAGVMAGLCGFYTFSVLPLAQSYAMLFASPLFITIFSIPLLGERVGPRRGAAVIVGLIGVLVVLRPGGAQLSFGHATGLMAALFASLNVIVTRKIGSEERPVVMLLVPMLANVVLMGAALPFVYRPMPAADLGMVAALAALAFIASWMIVKAYSAGEAGIVAPMQYSQILWATFYGWLYFSERMDGATFVGIALIIGSGVYIVLRESRGASENRPVSRSRFRFDTGTVLRIGAFLRRGGKRR